MSKFDELRNIQTEAEEREAPQFGPAIGCPTCHGTTGNVLVGRQWLNYCADHHCYWLAALRPWSAPFAELDAEQRRAWTEAGLEAFEQVQPWILGAAGSSPLAGKTLGEIAEMAEKPKS